MEAKVSLSPALKVLNEQKILKSITSRLHRLVIKHDDLSEIWWFREGWKASELQVIAGNGGDGANSSI